MHQESRAVTGNYHTVWDNSTESLHLILGQVNRNKSKTVGKHGDVVKKLLRKCVSEGLMHVAAWYHGTLGSIGQNPNRATFRCTLRQNVCEISTVKKFYSLEK